MALLKLLFEDRDLESGDMGKVLDHDGFVRAEAFHGGAKGVCGTGEVDLHHLIGDIARSWWCRLYWRSPILLWYGAIRSCCSAIRLLTRRRMPTLLLLWVRTM